MHIEDEDLDRLLKWLMVFLALLVVMQVAMMIVVWRTSDGRRDAPVDRPPPSPRVAPREDEVIEMGESVFGWDEALSDRGNSLFVQDLKGTVFAYPSSKPVVSVDALLDPLLSWPSTIASADYATTSWMYSVYALCDDETDVPGSLHSYLAAADNNSGVAQMRAAIYEYTDPNSALELVVGSGWVDVVEGAQWYEWDLANAQALVEDAQYALLVNFDGGAYDGGRFTYDMAPVQLQSTIMLSDALRTGVGLRSTIGVKDGLRVGVGLKSAIALEDELKTRLKPSAETGFCEGHRVRDEDAEGSFE